MDAAIFGDISQSDGRKVGSFHLKWRQAGPLSLLLKIEDLHEFQTEILGRKIDDITQKLKLLHGKGSLLD